MEQEKILLQIETELVALRTFIRKLKPEAKLHQLDIDLIRQKARSMYDSILMLEENPESRPKATVFDIKRAEPANVPDEHMDDSMESEKERMRKIADAANAEKIISSEEDVHHNIQEPVADEKVLESESTQEIVTPLEEKEIVVELDVEQPVAEPEEEVQNPAPEANHFEEFNQEPAQEADLFSSTHETIADKLSGSDKQTVADRLLHNNLKSLRQFIGINEKFLFINELFNGDMSKYNSAIDELDSMSTQEGTNIFLIELQVQNQWSEDIDAFLKMKELIEKKFSA